jgi:large subunit ribosomal protein L25
MSKAAGEVAIAAEARSDFGKGAARRIRRAGRIPAVIYGRGKDLSHVSLPGHELELALRDPRVVLVVSIAGSTVLTRAQEVQRDPVRRNIEHVDLVVIDRTEADARVKAGLDAAAALETAEA